MLGGRPQWAASHWARYAAKLSPDSPSSSAKEMEGQCWAAGLRGGESLGEVSDPTPPDSDTLSIARPLVEVWYLPRGAGGEWSVISAINLR